MNKRIKKLLKESQEYSELMVETMADIEAGFLRDDEPDELSDISGERRFA